jgi:hypothetical protein
MNNSLFYLCIATLLFTSCGSSLKSEEKEYQKAVDSYTASAWKISKTIIRASDEIQPEKAELGDMFSISVDSLGDAKELLGFVSDIEKEMKYDSTGKARESVNYVKLAKQIYQLKDAASGKDEDQYPLLLQRFSTDSGMMAMSASMNQIGYRYDANMEHFLLCFMTTLSLKTPREICLYELSKIDQSKIGNNELGVLTTVLASTNFILEDWNHLAEDRCTKSLESLNSGNLSAPLLAANSNGKFTADNKQMAENIFKGLLHGCRAWARSRMKKEDEAKEDIMTSVMHLSNCGMASPDLKLAAAMISIQAGDKDAAMKMLMEINASTIASTEQKANAETTLKLINEGKMEEVEKDMASKSDEASIGFLMVKDVCLYFLSPEDNSIYSGNGNGEDTQNPLYTYSKHYLGKYDDISSGLSIENATNEVKSWFE